MAKQNERRRMLGGVDRMTAGLYRLLARSWLGKYLTGYDGSPTRLLSGEGRAREVHTLSDGRCRIVRAAERSRVLAVLRELAHLLTDCPVRLYGLFFLLYGVTCCMIRLLEPFLIAGHTLDLHGIIVCGILALAALPAALARHRSLIGTIGSGKVGYALFCRVLGIPRERVSRPCINTPAVLLYVVAVLGAGAAAASVWIHPLIIPAAMLVLALLGMVLSFPETGVALSALLLPAAWIWDEVLYVIGGLILLCWVSYAFKLLLMHRTFRLGRLDAVMLLFGGLLICGSIVSVRFSSDGLHQGILMAALLSDYFLIVNLMNTRTALRRCMGGIGAALIMIALLSFVRLIPLEPSGWLAAYRLGAVLTDGLKYMIAALDALWSVSFEQYLILVLPWLLVFMLFCRRPLSLVPCIGLAAWCGYLIWRTGSPLGICIALFGCLLFAVLFRHTSLTVIIALLPLTLTGGFWYTFFHPIAEVIDWLEFTLREGMDRHFRVWAGVARMIRAYPAGVGLGSETFRTAYLQHAESGIAADNASSLYLDLLATLGIPGLATALVILIQFNRVCFTCLCRCRERWDRAVIIAGMCTVANFMLLGVFRSVGISPQLFFCLILVMGICSSLASVCADERELLTAEQMGETPERDDSFLWLDA